MDPKAMSAMNKSTSDTGAQRAPDMLPAGWLDYRNTGTRVLLRPGVVDTLGTEMATLGCERVMVVCGGNTRKSRLFERVMAALGPRAITVYDRVVEHSSVDMVTHGAELARELRVDGLLVLGQS
jgi:alcohol dehydrogenase class IV